MGQALRDKLGKRVRELRFLRGLKREELFLLLGFDNSYISKLEKGNINITLDKMEKIAEYFEISISELFDF